MDKRYCDKHKPKQQHVSKTSDYANEIHKSSKWRRTSELYREANPLCEQCLKASQEAGKRAGNRADKGLDMIQLATSVDHIVPLFAGGEPYDWSNLQSLCDYHHAIKSQREQEQKK
ncbi:HNH endonuclease (plasmid) [Lactiplantibacillus plantarum]